MLTYIPLPTDEVRKLQAGGRAFKKLEQFHTGRKTQRLALLILQCRQKLSIEQGEEEVAHVVGSVISS